MDDNIKGLIVGFLSLIVLSFFAWGIAAHVSFIY